MLILIIFSFSLCSLFYETIREGKYTAFILRRLDGGPSSEENSCTQDRMGFRVHIPVFASGDKFNTISEESMEGKVTITLSEAGSFW
jgi:hypothetical protein